MNSNRALTGTVSGLLFSLLLAGGISSGSALARGVIIEIAPPAAQVEVVPAQRRGYTWAPGYWAWQRDKHVWVGGHTMKTRSGYEWNPDHWNQANGRHEFQAGRWTRATRANELHGQ